MPYHTADHQRFIEQKEKGNLRSGQRLSRKEILDIVQKHNPTLQRSSIHPSDHDNIGNKGECGCHWVNDHIFERRGRDDYKVVNRAGSLTR
jgi:hypothetical protein